MAKRRMFSLDIVDTDKFLELPPTTQALYFHLGMRCDDDGFVGNPKKIAKITGAGEVDLNLLCQAGYLIPFKSGVVVITHFNMQNTIYLEAVTLAANVLGDIIRNDTKWDKFESSRKFDKDSFNKFCTGYLANIQGSYFLKFSPEQLNYIKSFARNIIFFSFTDNTFKNIKSERENLKDPEFFIKNVIAGIFENLIIFDRAYRKVYGEIDVKIKKEQNK